MNKNILKILEFYFKYWYFENLFEYIIGIFLKIILILNIYSSIQY